MLRIQKYLSECGICSRRHAEDAIRNGEITVNGVVAKIGQSIDPEKDRIEFSGKFVDRRQKYVYYAINKPRGIETTCAQKGGESIVDIVDIPTRVFPIGRLDKDSSGLILLTNDGRITHRLLHPSFEHEKEYLVTTYGRIEDQALEQMRKGVRYTDNRYEIIDKRGNLKKPPFERGMSSEVRQGDFAMKNPQSLLRRASSFRKGALYQKPFFERGIPPSGGRGVLPGKILSPAYGGTAPFGKEPYSNHSFIQTQPCEIHRAGSDMFRIVLKEGKNRQIRRMVEACGYEVKKLKRIRIEHIELRDMPEGAYRELQRGEREELLRRSGLPLLDYAPIVGEVIHGNGRGHKLGFPTANILFPPGKLPDETFSCRVTLDKEIFLGAGTFNPNKKQNKINSDKTPFLKGDIRLGGEGDLLNKNQINPPPSVNFGLTRDAIQGISPLQEGGLGTFEVHILDFDRDIYGKTLQIDLMDSIRKNQKFASVDALKTQIEKDVHHVRAHWNQMTKMKKMKND